MVERREEIKDGAANKKGERRSEGGLFCNSKPGLMKVKKNASRTNTSCRDWVNVNAEITLVKRACRN